MSKYHTKKGVPMSEPLNEVLTLCEFHCMELKPLVLGIRIVGTDVVVSDAWKGLYLCKSGGRGLKRMEHEGAVLKLADKGQWCVSLPQMATDEEGAKSQADALLYLASKAGYFLPGMKIEQKPSAQETQVKAPVEEGNGRRKKAKKVVALDEALQKL